MPPAVTMDALLKLAVEALPGPLSKLNERGVAYTHRVYAFFNGAIPPGIGVAITQAESGGLSRVEARGAVDGLIADAEAQGQFFALGSMLSPDDLMNLLHSSTRDDAIHKALDRLSATLAQRVPSNHLRLVLVDGSETKLYLVELEGEVVVRHFAHEGGRK